jgi:hypothetical protein
VKAPSKAWIPLGVVCSAAVVWAMLAAEPESSLPSDDELNHKLFRAVATEETHMRRDAAKAFPTDLWSRDDDFHQHEGRKVRDWAGAHHMPISDGFWAMDEGLRAHWPHGNPGPLVTTTPPCRPRAIY